MNISASEFARKYVVIKHSDGSVTRLTEQEIKEIEETECFFKGVPTKGIIIRKRRR